MAERSKALRSGRSPLLWAWVRIPLLTRILLAVLVVTLYKVEDPRAWLAPSEAF